VIGNGIPFRAVSAGGGIAAIVWFARALHAVAARVRGPEGRYWVLKGRRKDFYVHARLGCQRCAALCVFDSEGAAREPLSTLSEPRMFLDTLEFYGASMPSWVREESLLPRIQEVSARELGRIIEETGVSYVALNPPPPGEKAKTFELWRAGSFLREQACRPRTRA
jgi:hypothetical protein